MIKAISDRRYDGTALPIENSHTQIALFSKTIRQHVQQMPFFENGTSARCTSFGPYFNNGNQNPFYIELAQTENYYGERLRNQASFTVGFTGGGGCH
jgi:hypothetical protein